MRHQPVEIVSAIAAGGIDHRQFRPERPRLLRELGACHAPGQVDVGEEHVDGAAAIDVVERLVGGGRLVDLAAQFAQPVADQHADEGFVLDQKDRDRRHDTQLPFRTVPPRQRESRRFGSNFRKLERIMVNFALTVRNASR